MKKITIITLMFTVLFGYNTQAKKKPNGFTGTITYKITYEGRELSSNEEAQMPNKQISYFTAEKNMEKVITPMGYYKTINNFTTGEEVIIIEMMGQSMFGKLSKEDIDKQKEGQEIFIQVFDDQTKTILGYKCKKAEITVKKAGKEIKLIVYFTQELKPVHVDEEYKDINGIVLEKQVVIGEGDDELTMIMTATEIKKGKVKSVEFIPPSGARELTKEQLMKMNNAIN